MLKQAATLLALAVAMSTATAGSAAAAGWQPADILGVGAFPKVAVDAQGNAVGVWARHVSFIKWEIVASSRPRGGKWTAPVAISGDTRTGEILRSKVAVDPNGNAVAVWAARPPEDEGNENIFKSLWSASRSPGGAWSEPEEISVASGVSEFEVVIDASGAATAIWHSFKEGEDDPPGSFVRAANLPLNGEWSDPVELSGTNGANAQVAVNPDGDATAVWTGADPDTGYPVVRTESRPAGGPWGATATDLSSGAGRASGVQVAVDPDGNAIAAWSYSECNNPEQCKAYEECTNAECREGLDISRDYVVQTAYRRDSSGTWSEPTPLWDDAADQTSPQVALAVDPQGDASAIWSSFGPGGRLMRSSTRTAGAEGTWSTPVELSAADGGSLQGKPTNPRIVADPQGSLTATWSAAIGPNPGIGVTENRRLQAVHRPAGDEWSSPVALATPDDVWAAEIAVDPLGYVTTVWWGGVTDAVKSRVFDPYPAPDPPDDPDPPSDPDPPDDPDPPGDPNPPDDPDRPEPREPDPEVDPDPVAPRVSDLRQSNSRWRAQGARASSRAPLGTTFRFKLDRPAWVQLAFSRVEVGRRDGGRCARASRANAGKPRCPRYRGRGRLQIAGAAGANAYRFRGRIWGDTLEPGRYRLRLIALADGKRSAPAPIEFTIVR